MHSLSALNFLFFSVSSSSMLSVSVVCSEMDSCRGNVDREQHKLSDEHFSINKLQLCSVFESRLALCVLVGCLVYECVCLMLFPVGVQRTVPSQVSLLFLIAVYCSSFAVIFFFFFRSMIRYNENQLDVFASHKFNLANEFSAESSESN